MSTIRLLVLGVVALHHQTHGYAIQRELQGWNIEAWTKVRPGSIYHALGQLTKEGKLSQEGQVSSAKGPDKGLYRLTASGRRELEALLRDALVSTEQQALAPGVALMTLLPRGAVIEALSAQIGLLALYRQRLGDLQPGFEATREQPPHSADLLALWNLGLTSQSAWTQNLLERIQAGGYVFKDEEPSGQA